MQKFAVFQGVRTFVCERFRLPFVSQRERQHDTSETQFFMEAKVLIAMLVVSMAWLSGCSTPPAPTSTQAAQPPTLIASQIPSSAASPTSGNTYAPIVVNAVASPTSVSTNVPIILSTQPVPTTGTYAPIVIGSDASPTPIQPIVLSIKGQALQIELASTDEQRSLGYMDRTSIPEGTGMLFVFANDQQLNFWMRNTPTALSIAFIDSQKRILNLADMQPYDDKTIHQSQGLARYALEVPQGWFAEHGIQAGDSVEFSLPDGLVIE